MLQNILIVWHIPSYGIGYFKNVLSAFYTRKVSLNQKEAVEGMSQLELEKGFLNSEGFLFDKVYYLYFSDETSYKISDRRKVDYINGRAKVELVNDDIIKKTKTLNIWEEVFKLNFKTIKEELSFVKNKYPKKYDLFSSQYWRNIHYYPIAQQIEWFSSCSNASKIYGTDRVDFIDFTSLFDVKDLRDEDSLTSSFANFLLKYNLHLLKTNYFFNSGLGTMEMQLAIRSVTSDTRFKNFSTSIFSIVDQKENTSVNYRFRDLKYSFKKTYLSNLQNKQYVNTKNQKDYYDFVIYPNEIVRIKFQEISFITTCHSDTSKNDRYLQRVDGKFHRIVNQKINDLEKILPQENFCRINKSTIISNNNDNIHGWSTNFEEVTLRAAYIKNNGQYLETKKTEKEYENDFLNKPVKFTVGKDYVEKFKEWLDII